MTWRTGIFAAVVAAMLGVSAQPPPEPGPETDRGAETSPPPDGASDPDEPEEPDGPWSLPDALLERLAGQAEVYRDYLLRFTCIEKARVAHYDESNEASRESMREYDYLLERDPEGGGLREYREVVKRRKKTGETKPSGREAEDPERFPPAYAWVFLFAKEQQPFFMYRSLGDRFEGFDWVHEIQFRGAVPFSDGKDIRQWEGTVLVDAVTHSPVEIRAEPAAQKERIRSLFDQWSKSFNIVGIRTAPRPFGYRCRVGFGLRRDRLAFPTELRYDTFRAVSAKQNVPWMASVRTYDSYRFFKTSTTETPVLPANP